IVLGCAPFRAASIGELRTLQEQGPAAPRSLWPDIPELLDLLIVDLLSPDPRARPSAQLAAECFEAAWQELAAHAPDEATLPASDRVALVESPSAVPAPPPMLATGTTPRGLPVMPAASSDEG